MLQGSGHIKKGLSKEVTSEPPPEEHWKQVKENNSTVPEQENVALEREECRGQWGSLPPPRFLGGEADLPMPGKLSKIPADVPVGIGQCHSLHKRGEDKDKTLILTVGESKQRTKRDGGCKKS